MQRLAACVLIAAASALPAITSTGCKYASYGENVTVFTGDDACGTSCVVEATTCRILYNVTTPTAAYIPPYYLNDDDMELPPYDAVGNLAACNISMPWLYAP
uniref:Secreted protein n=1 Tax=Achlya hypogyna TaxID=1202772 RepID=A0A0A7CNW7_ACHHY|nr:secreted protein [Achlya hypogyna]